MKKFTTKDRIYNENGLIMLSVTGRAVYHQSKSLDEVKEYEIYKHYENGECFCRYLYYSVYGGYYVSFPGDNERVCGQEWTAREEEFDECNSMNFASDYITKEEINLIAEKYPDFKYTLKKWKCTRRQALNTLMIWKDHKEIEFMLAAGLEKLAFSKKFWNMKESERRRIINFIKTNSELKNRLLNELLVMMKYSLSIAEYDNYVYEKQCAGVGAIGYDTYRYLKSVDELNYAGKRLYSDYKKLLSFSTHNKNEKYWKYPKDLKARHDKLVVEVGNLKDLEDKARLEKQQAKYLKAVSGFVNLDGLYDGYSIFIPQEVEQIRQHAKKLNQCLVACDYIGKVIDGRCLLVFVMKDGESIATAELLPGNRIGQFYGNELDRKNCRPDEKVKAAFNKWLDHKKELEKNEKKRSA